MIVPDTDVYLIKCPLEISDNNQITFANATAQYNYFQSLPKLYLENYTYQRRDGVLRVGELIDDIQEYNYVMYRNTNHSNKWFYAYITDMEYLNDNVTAVSIRTDVFQTWQFDLIYKKTFVEREHVNDDTFGIHTIPENLEVGEYVKNTIVATPNPLQSANCWICIGVSEIVGSLSKQPASYIHGIPNGLYYIFTDQPNRIQDIAYIYDLYGKAECITTIFVFPELFLTDNHSNNMYESATWSWDDGQGHSGTIFDNIYVPKSSNEPRSLGTFVTTLPTKIGQTYTPKNNKLKCYPYCYFTISNNAGSSVVYHYEDFSGSPAFAMDGCLTVGGSIKIYPTNYKNFTLSGDNTYDYGINAGKYPTLSWRSDSYTNWLTQNAVNTGISVASDYGQLLLGLAGAGLTASTGGIAGAFGTLSMAQSGANFLSQIAQTCGKIHQASFIPDQVKGNINAGDINYAKNNNCFTVMEMSIKPEYAKICDDFFSMFGYKVNELKFPNVTGRRNWNYVKTVGCYIAGDIPQEDMDEIKTLFDKGITFWHNTSTFMDYSQNNDII